MNINSVSSIRQLTYKVFAAIMIVSMALAALPITPAPLPKPQVPSQAHTSSRSQR